jgi:hypothetical protein
VARRFRPLKKVKSAVAVKTSFRTFGPNRSPATGKRKTQQLHGIKSSHKLAQRLRIKAVKKASK